MTASPDRPATVEPPLPEGGRPDWAGAAPTYYHAWAEQQGRAWAPRPALAEDRHAQVCVVGGGLTGTSAALALAEAGYEVVLLERSTIGEGASGRNGGQVVTGYNSDMATLAKRQGETDARRLWELALEGRERVAERVQRHAIPANFQRGYAVPATGRRGVRELQALKADWAAYGYATELVTGRDVRAVVDSPAYDAVLVDDGAGHLDPLALTRGYAQAAEAAGAQLYETSPVATLAAEGNQPAVTLANGGRVTADWLVLAGNTGQLGLHRALCQGAFAVPTFMLATEPLPVELAQSMIPASRAISEDTLPLNYFRLSPDNRLLFGGEVSLSGRVPDDVAGRLKAAAQRLFPQLGDVAVDFWWGGLVDISGYRVPKFYRLGPRCLALQGFSGQGLALTTLAGVLAQEAVAGDPRRFEVFARMTQPRLPARFGRTLALRAGFWGHWLADRRP